MQVRIPNVILSSVMLVFGVAVLAEQSSPPESWSVEDIEALRIEQQEPAKSMVEEAFDLGDKDEDNALNQEELETSILRLYGDEPLGNEDVSEDLSSIPASVEDLQDDGLKVSEDDLETLRMEAQIAIEKMGHTIKGYVSPTAISKRLGLNEKHLTEKARKQTQDATHNAKNEFDEPAETSDSGDLQELQ